MCYLLLSIYLYIYICIYCCLATYIHMFHLCNTFLYIAWLPTTVVTNATSVERVKVICLVVKNWVTSSIFLTQLNTANIISSGGRHKRTTVPMVIVTEWCTFIILQTYTLKRHLEIFIISIIGRDPTRKC